MSVLKIYCYITNLLTLTVHMCLCYLNTNITLFRTIHFRDLPNTKSNIILFSLFFRENSVSDYTDDSGVIHKLSAAVAVPHSYV